MKSTEIFESSSGAWCLHLLLMKRRGLGLFRTTEWSIMCSPWDVLLGRYAGDTWGSAMGLRWKWVLLVTSTTGSCSWISKNICERQHRWESNWRRKHTHTIVSSMQAVLLVTHGLSLNTRLDIKHFPSFMQQQSSARNVTRSWKEGKKSNILNSWVSQVKHTTSSTTSNKFLSDRMPPCFSARWPCRQNMSSSCTITGAHSMVL